MAMIFSWQARGSSRQFMGVTLRSHGMIDHLGLEGGVDGGCDVDALDRAADLAAVLRAWTESV